MKPKLILADLNPDVVSAWQSAFEKEKDVEIRLGDALNPTPKVLATASNSFGYMDGGLDGAIASRWPHLERSIQERMGYPGYIPVGQVRVIGNPLDKGPDVLIFAPTMFLPGDNISGTANVYLATRAILRAIRECNMDSVTITGLGTGVGKMLPHVCAMQMYYAYRDEWVDQRDISNIEEHKVLKFFHGIRRNPKSDVALGSPSPPTTTKRHLFQRWMMSSLRTAIDVKNPTSYD